MKVLIMGCGRVGSRLAGMLDAEGHEVTILDTSTRAFRRLPPEFKGTKHVGNGIDIDTLRKVGAGEADAFVAATQGDNRNVMATQMAKHLFNVPRTLCRIYDPIREEIYNELGLETISPTVAGADMFKERLEAGPSAKRESQDLIG